MVTQHYKQATYNITSYFSNLVDAASSNDLTQTLKNLTRDYDKRVRPNFGGKYRMVFIRYERYILFHVLDNNAQEYMNKYFERSTRRGWYNVIYPGSARNLRKGHGELFEIYNE